MQKNGEIRTLEDGLARLYLPNGSSIVLAPQTAIILLSLERDPNGISSRLSLQRGQIWVFLNGGILDIETPAGIASVRGSYLSVQIDPTSGEVRITCLEGDCTLVNQTGSYSLVAGQAAIITNFDSPPTPGLMSEEDLHAWLMANPEATVIIPAMSATISVLPTGIATTTFTPTPTDTPTATATLEPGVTPTETPPETHTPTVTLSPTATQPGPSPTPQPTQTKTKTPQPTSTKTPGPSPTNTPIPSPTNTPVPSPTRTPLPPSPTNTPLPTSTNTPEPTGYPPP
ncbi:MAG: FecR domain-containing protein [Chloroflexota bacterium]